jgi:hypothetical protein
MAEALKSELPTSHVMGDNSPSRTNGFSGWLPPLLIISLAIIWVPEILTRPLFGDDSFYLWSAKQMGDGVFPARDFYCIDTVGILAYFRLLYVLGCHGSVSYWASIAVNVFVAASLLGMAARRVTGLNSTGTWAGLLYAVFLLYCTPTYGLVGKDMLAMPFLLGGFLLAGSTRWWIPGHLLVGCAVAIKPTLGVVWVCWMTGHGFLNRSDLGRWLFKAFVGIVLISTPFIVVTIWAEQHGWGLAILQSNKSLPGNYGHYLLGANVYKLAHALVPVLWMVPAAILGFGSLSANRNYPCLLLLSLLSGGFVNWAIQPMFNAWYFVPFIAGIVILAAMGMDRLVPGKTEQLAGFIALGLFFAFVPSTNLRWVKLLWDIGGKEKYTLAEHQSRLMQQYGTGNTPPYVQNWVRNEIAKIVPAGAKVGITVTDGNLLWALRDYTPGFWADWCPSWNPEKLAAGLNAASAAVVVGVQTQTRGSKSVIYYDQVAQLQWQMPEEAINALAKNYREVTNQFGYVIYRQRERNP